MKLFTTMLILSFFLKWLVEKRNKKIIKWFTLFYKVIYNNKSVITSII